MVHVYSPSRKLLYELKPDPKKKIEFTVPSYMAIDKKDNIFFVDPMMNSVLEYGKGGRFKRTIGKKGMAAGELFIPTGIAVDNAGDILVGLGESPNIQAFSNDGKFLYALCNEKCDNPIDIATIRGFCVDSRNRLYIAEAGRDRVTVFQLLEGTVDITPK